MKYVFWLKRNGLFQKILRGLYYFFFLAASVSFFIFYSEWPKEIPLHFNLNGQVARTGNKEEILVVFFILLLISMGIYLLHYVPHVFNYPNSISEQNRESVYAVSSSFMLILSIFVLFIIFVVELSTREILYSSGTFWRNYGIYFVAGSLILHIILWLYILNKILISGDEEP